MAARYAGYGRPTQLERHVKDFFDDWVAAARDHERKSRAKEVDLDVAVFEFGTKDREAWSNWLQFVETLTEGVEEEEPEEDE